MLPKTRLTPEVLMGELDRLERQYQMSSGEFYGRFHEGTLPEDQEFIRWAWLCTVAMRQGLLSITPSHA